MAVKRNQSASRILLILETIANQQPIGIRALGRHLNEDKSTVQRAVMTLADEGWIRPAGNPSAGWEVTAHILAVAHAALGGNDLRRRARPVLERLRDESEETVMLIVPDVKNFVVADVVESRHMLRMVPNLGILVSAHNTATGRAMLPYFDAEKRIAFIGRKPESSLLDGFEATRRQGFAVSDGEINRSATSIASAILEFDGQPVGAIVVTAPSERLGPSRQKKVGVMVARAAKEISRVP